MNETGMLLKRNLSGISCFVIYRFRPCNPPPLKMGDFWSVDVVVGWVVADYAGWLCRLILSAD